jgi:hypothetical protein
MGPYFTQASGRQVYIEQLFFKSSTQGILLGDSSYIQKELIRRLPDTVRKNFWDCKATLIIQPPPGERIPRYTFIAHLVSDEVSGQEPGDYSRMLVAWFQDHIDGTLTELVHDALRLLEWDRHAENWID